MRAPNEKLRDLFDRSGLSQSELARRVQRRAREHGHKQVSCDASRVRRWMAGMAPRTPLPTYIADVLSAHFGYRVTTYDLGLGERPDLDRSLAYSPSWTETVESVTDLGRADMDRRDLLAALPFTAVAGIEPSRRWLLNTLDQEDGNGGAEPSGTRRVRIEDVTSVRNMFAAFQDIDVMQGGGTGRKALMEYMNQHVYPLLRRTFDEEVHRALCAAVCEQTYLLGWMEYDDGNHSAAQRFLIQSLRLAEESRDAALGAHVLAGMADQATLTGNPEEGRRLAQTGRHGLARVQSPACLADLWVLEARALALLGDKTGTARAVAASERAFARAGTEKKPTWAKFIDGAYIHGEMANAFRDLNQPENAAEHARRSIDYARQQGRARRGAMSQAALAVSHLQRRDLESAHAASVKTIDLARRVKSSRAVEALHDVQRRMVPFGTHPLVADINERAQVLAA